MVVSTPIKHKVRISLNLNPVSFPFPETIMVISISAIIPYVFSCLLLPITRTLYLYFKTDFIYTLVENDGKNSFVGAICYTMHIFSLKRWQVYWLPSALIFCQQEPSIMRWKHWHIKKFTSVA